MRGLNLAGRGLAGHVADALGRLSDLFVLDLGANEMSGEFPAEAGQLVNLRRMDLRGNRLEGCIPDVLRHVEIHTRLRLCDWGTARDGGIPPPDSCANGVVVPNPADNPGLVSDCEVLVEAQGVMSEEGLRWSTGIPIGAWEGVLVWGDPLRVRSVAVVDVGLNGRIPPELGRLAGLEELELQKNMLTGGVPSELGSLANLRLLDLSENLLTGEIPSGAGQSEGVEGLAAFQQ